MMIDIMMKDYKMNYFMEVGFIMENDKIFCGEFYMKVIFMCDGICNVVVCDFSCFGK